MENILSRWREIIDADQIGEFIKAAQTQLLGWGDLNFYFVTLCIVIAFVLLLVSVTWVVLKTAHEGKLLEDVYFPARAFIGIGGLIPLPGGFCTIQYISLFFMGLGLAVAITLNNVGHNISTQFKPVFTASNLPKTDALFDDLLRMEYCKQISKHSLLVRNRPGEYYFVHTNPFTVKNVDTVGDWQGNTNSLGGWVDLATSSAMTQFKLLGSKVGLADAPGGAFRRYDSEGFSYDLWERNRLTGEQKPIKQAVCGRVLFDNSSFDQPLLQPLLDAHKDTVITFTQGAIRDLATRLYDHFYSKDMHADQVDQFGKNYPDLIPISAEPSAAEYADIKARFGAMVRNRAAVALANIREQSPKAQYIQKKVQELGFFSAGASWLVISQQQQELANALKAIPTTTPPDIASFPSLNANYESYYNNKLRPFFDWMTKAKGEYWKQFPTGSTYADIAPEFAQAMEIKAWGAWKEYGKEVINKKAITAVDEKNALEKLVAETVQDFTQYTTAAVLAAPMATISNFGNTLQKRAGLAAGASTFVNIFTKDSVTGFVKTISLTLFVVGAFLADGLPWLVNAAWTLAVYGWGIMGLIVIVGGPVWATAHMIFGNKNDPLGKAREGWNILIEVSLTPILLVVFLHLLLKIFPLALALIMTNTGGLLEIGELANHGNVTFYAFGLVSCLILMLFLGIGMLWLFAKNTAKLMRFLGLRGVSHEPDNQNQVMPIIAGAGSTVNITTNALNQVSGGGTGGSRGGRKRPPSMQEHDYIG
jgi:conjugal transfer/type IV secretion protein DotA/TraY